ncbi:MAG: eukaryotic-like serine/threonine-protein kinase [Acidobacteriota bacterium]|jgi:Tol biopolymer transport system component|nr:eukaryotic-like serine/threonine-protein kinase [Acidobacteriota bacterium]
MMATDRWQQIKEIFHSALERGPAERPAYLAGACAGDESIRSEVESLIAAHEKDGSFIDSPAYEVAAAWLAEDGEPDPLVGQQINRYKVLSQLGAGGMGEVYLAQDTKLGRKIALKLLPASFTNDADRLHRFQQEARTASSLNHPNILTIYEIGDEQGLHFIATELIEGQTLRGRLASVPLELSDALDIILQAASALAAAHEVGIVHRDVKPENIMLRTDGYVKVLDFGLAKLADPKATRAELEAPTRMRGNTTPGMVMGTVNYMSPEQARGLDVDERTDIWSLGVVLYEMLSGSVPFKGETPTDVTVSILEREPVLLATLSEKIPAELDWIVKKTLRKDREERYQTVREMLGDLRSVKQQLDFEARLEQSSTPLVRESEAVATTIQQPHKRIADEAVRTDEIQEARATAIVKPAHLLSKNGKRSSLLALVAAVLIAAATFGIYRLVSRSQSQNASAEKNNVTEAPGVANIARVTVWSGLDTQPTLSPDGNSVAYSSNHNGNFEIYVKQLTPGGREIQLTSDGQENFQPAWSPDGQRIAYYSKRRGGIWIVPTLGGAARQLTESGSGPKWSHDGAMIAFQSDANPDLGSGSVGSSTIWIVPSQGGTPKQVTKVGNPAGGHVSPTWSPDNQRIAFVALNFSRQQIWSVSINGDNLKQMTKDNMKSGYPLYSPDGRSLYFAGGPIVGRLPISTESGEPTGNPVKVTDAGASIVSSLTLSADGKRMAYSVQTLTSNIWSVPISPSTSEATGPPQPLTNQTGTRNNQPAFSPDGRKLAFMEYLRGGGADIWVADADGQNPVQVTSSTKNLVPNWFPDGDQIAFVSNRDNHWSVWATSLQSRREHLLFDIGRDIQYARLSPDGQRIVLNLADGGIINLWTVPVSGGQPKQLTFDQELAGFGCWSPDGKFIAYQMKRGDDAYLMIIPSDGGDPVQLTFDHGRGWPYSFSPDGDKILFAGERNGVWNVWWYSRSTKQQKQLTNHTKLNSYVRYPAWSPRGNQIAYEYAETSGNIWMLDLK